MSYDLPDIEALIAVVESGSISAAATRLDLSKSVVSERITKLESSLGAELLHRSTRGVTPTEKGREFYERVRAIFTQLDEAQEAVQESSDDLVGGVRIAGPMSFGTRWLAPALFDLAAKHPRLNIALELDDRIVDLLAGGYDLGVRMSYLPDSSLVARKLATVRRIIVCSPEYAKTHELPRTLADLPQHESIGYSLLTSGQVWQFQGRSKGADSRSVAMPCRAVINNGDAIREAAARGLGLALLPSFIVADALREKRLIAVRLDAEPTTSTISALLPHTKNPSRKVRKIIEHLREAFADGGPWERDLAI